jgi:hypothetical protein
MMLPKDLLNDLEKGNRVMEMLKVPEQPLHQQMADPFNSLLRPGKFFSSSSMASFQHIEAQQQMMQRQAAALGGFVWG